MDYGFPSWEQLKVSFREQIQAGRFNLHPAVSKVERWIRDWENGTELRTIDKLVYEESYNDRALEELFQALMFKAIIRAESKFCYGGWIKRFSHEVLNTLYDLRDPELIKEKLSKIRFITLNYDRCFEFVYMRSGAIPALSAALYNHQAHARNFLSEATETHYLVVHPHGAIGSLPAEQGKAVPKVRCSTHMSASVDTIDYGDLAAHLDHTKCSMMAVDQACAGQTPAYDEANQILSETDTVFCIGLSETGLKSSNLVFKKSSDIHFWSPSSVSAETQAEYGLRIHRGDAMDFAASMEGDVPNIASGIARLNYSRGLA